MAEQNKERQIERALDSLLASYSDAEPRTGLEARILANLEAESVRHRRGNKLVIWMWAGIGAAATLAALVLAIRLYPRPELPTPPNWAGRPPIIENHPERGANPPGFDLVATPGKHERVHTNHPNPEESQRLVAVDIHKEVFPTPSPLSEQEQLFLWYLRSTPREEVVAQSHADKTREELEADPGTVPISQSATQQPSNTR